MYARVTTIYASPERVDEGAMHFKDEVLPMLQDLPGFKGGYLLVDFKSGRMIEITLWATEAEMQASSEIASTLSAESAEVTTAAAIPAMELYEVAYQP
ncbi:MAG: hypothetical protein M1380_11805 [Chloroflexi bacterium]|nr:hypothetical protein [Chloroflexota bacterium]MCL5026148.1 hypothetical protein [Chloroflexota bacterium]